MLQEVEQVNYFKPAIDLAGHWHADFPKEPKNAFRDDGVTPYIRHPIAVANNLRRHGFEHLLPLAALFHDILEDTIVKAEEMYFHLQPHYTGEITREIINLVQSVTDPDWDTMGQFSSSPEKYRKPNRATRKAFLAQKYFTTYNMNTLCLKMADRIENVKDSINDKETTPPDKFDKDWFLQYGWESITLLNMLWERMYKMPDLGVKHTTPVSFLMAEGRKYAEMLPGLIKEVKGSA